MRYFFLIMLLVYCLTLNCISTQDLTLHIRFLLKLNRFFGLVLFIDSAIDSLFDSDFRKHTFTLKNVFEKKLGV